MEGAGPALMGIGIAEGDTRAKDAAALAVNSPLLDVSITGAKGVLFVVAGSDDLGILEVQEAAKVVSDSVDKDAKVIFGIMRDEKLKKGQIRIIVIATGFPDEEGKVHAQAPERSLFSMPLPEKVETTRGRIYNDMPRREEQVVEEEKAPEPAPLPAAAPHLEVMRREEPIVTAQPNRREDEGRTITPPVVEEEEDAWGAIPNFLKRHKK
jgi:cell division GTPase FtsZ